VKKGKCVLEFDRHIKNSNGYLLGIEMSPVVEGEMAQVILDQGRKINFDILHDMLGHPSNEKIMRTAKLMGWTTTKSKHRCENCAVAKSKRKNLPKTNEKTSETVAERICIDISPSKNASYGGSRFWLLVVDEATNFM